MRLTHIRICGYKHLKKIEFNMSQSSEEVPVDFCVGLNGTGKSAFLEAVALIFSRITQNELPGFDFVLGYSVFEKGKIVQVEIRPEKESGKGRLHITVNGQVYSSFLGIEQYLPYKIITYISGPNSQMKQMLQKEAENSIISDIYDAGTREDGEHEIKVLLNYLNQLQKNPRMLYLSEEMVSLIFLVLCAWKPGQDNGYAMFREMLLKKLGDKFCPVAFSLEADETRIESALFEELFLEDEKGESQLYDWKVSDGDTIKAVYEISGERAEYCNKAISRRYYNPLQLLLLLLQAKNALALKACHVFFHTETGAELLNECALSDGELLWVARMGLVLLCRQEETDNCLFLFDEPDIHLNESWNVDFVASLRKFTQLNGRSMHHAFWISTHSSLLLTDALPDHVFLFEREKGNVSARKIPISMFAASRNEISKTMFQNAAQIGNYADKILQAALREENPDKLLQYINWLGAGIGRFRLMDKYYSIMEKRNVPEITEEFSEDGNGED
ncbi:hypothetical protein [Blautia sp.]|uniref:hypothetical protein n=1 Tax=Blautia sp. TaxID=1955243 RepID=UPI00399327BC